MSEEPSSSNPVITKQPSAPVENERDAAFRKRLRKIATLLILATLVVGGGAYAIVSILKSPERISGQFVDYLQANNVPASYKLIDDNAKAQLDQDGLARMFASTSKWVVGNESTIETRKESTRALYIYKVPTKDGDKYIKTVLTLRGGNWKVSYYDASSVKYKNDFKSF